MVKIIPYYLPQFHVIPENNSWWGEGFTEWTNVKNAKPMFDGHYQPKLPFEYYDLSHNYVLENQISMAKKFGIYGFCFHYYWFKGKRLLEKPIEDFLDNKSSESNFPFMLCWANENWTRRWDGKENDILISQEHSLEDHYNITDNLMRFFNDPRYIKVDEKPVILIYRPEIILKFPELVQIMRKISVKNGFAGIHIVATNSFGFRNHKGYKIDGIAEFPPHHVKGKQSFFQKKEIKNISNEFKGNIYDYKFFRDSCLDNYKIINSNKKDYAYYPATFPSWDNTPRLKCNGNMWIANDSEEFYYWLIETMKFSSDYNSLDDNFVFINAWNEWGEGAFLEPDKINGFDNLLTVKRAIKSFGMNN